MAYCTQQDMIDRYGSQELIQLTDRVEVDEIDTAVLGAAIDDATGAIDAYLAKRYALPLLQVPVVLKRLCCDIARYYLHGGELKDSVVKDRFDAAIEMLQAVVSGELDLMVSDTTGSNSDVVYESGIPVFDETQNWP